MRVKVYTKTGTLQMREDAVNMTLNELDVFWDEAKLKLKKS